MIKIVWFNGSFFKFHGALIKFFEKGYRNLPCEQYCKLS